MRQADWCWPTDDRMAREMEQSQIVARRRHDVRKRQSRRQNIKDFGWVIVALALLALVCALMWGVV
jgi:hypothetical protein